MKPNKTSKHWTKDEDKILRDKYPIMGSDIVSLLPGRSRNACRQRASMLNIAKI